MARARRSGLPLGPDVLTILVALQAISGLGGGTVLVADPAGGLIGMPLSVLRRGPFVGFLLPGAILLTVLGAFPAAIAAALWRRPRWAALRELERAFSGHGSWVGAGVVGVGLLLWLAVEPCLVGPSSLLVMYSVLALAIAAFAMMPGTRRRYRA
ncbi:MAG: hypothetical protein P8Y05_15250 [Deinococcales bacterium]|jgi:hypothetical protein